MAADWLERAVFDGLSRLVLATLDYAPAADTLPGVAKVWAASIRDNRVYEEELDLWRIQKAFRTLSHSSSRWPSPALLLAAMPQRRPLKQLRPPPPNPEVARTAFAEISAMLRKDPESSDQPNIRRYLSETAKELEKQLNQARQGDE